LKMSKVRLNIAATAFSDAWHAPSMSRFGRPISFAEAVEAAARTMAADKMAFEFVNMKPDLL
jgi:hypothetical protein